MWKKFKKDSMGLAVTGIGLSAVAGLDETGSVSAITKKMPIMGSMIGTGAVLGSIGNLNKQIKKIK